MKDVVQRKEQINYVSTWMKLTESERIFYPTKFNWSFFNSVAGHGTEFPQ